MDIPELMYVEEDSAFTQRDKQFEKMWLVASCVLEVACVSIRYPPNKLIN